jgi:hypothetical protein
MPPLKTFSFRQRVGHLNWKLISSTDLFRIVDNVEIDELQGILDPVTFCEFTVTDVKRNTVESVTKLVHIMQFLIEYLLYSQEAQMRLVQELRGRNSMMKKAIKSSSRENASLLEDIKIYKRQLAMLKQSITQIPTYDTPLIIRRDNEKDDKAPDLSRILEPLCHVIEVVQLHEKETRDFIKANASSKHNEAAASDSTIKEVKELIASFTAQQSLYAQKMNEEVFQREIKLNERSAMLERLEMQLKEKIDSSNVEAHAPKTSIGLNTSMNFPSTQRKTNANFLALSLIFRIISSG